MRGALEFGFYTEESDGVLLDRTKFFWNADYGHLAFTSDHQRIQNCDGDGRRRRRALPGRRAGDRRRRRRTSIPTRRATTRRSRKCDMRNSALGYSGSMGNAVRITNNHIYGNATGIASDTLSSAGHPGLPGRQRARSTTTSSTRTTSTSTPTTRRSSRWSRVPIGTGIIYAGMNDARVHDNWFFDNWRDGDDAVRGARRAHERRRPGGRRLPGRLVPGRADNGLSTSCGNRYFDNKMGQVPAGFKFPATLDQYGVPHGDDGAATAAERQRLLVGRVRQQHRELLVRQHGPGRHGRERHRPGRRGPDARHRRRNALPDCAGGDEPGLERRRRRRGQDAYLVDCSNGPDKDTGPLDCDWWSVAGEARAAPRRRGASAQVASAPARSSQARPRPSGCDSGWTRSRPGGGGDDARAGDGGCARRAAVAAAGCGDDDGRRAGGVRRRRSRSARRAGLGRAVRRLRRLAARGTRGRAARDGRRAARPADAADVEDRARPRCRRPRRTRLLDKTCSTSGVESLRLYKLYVRMQGFAPLMD